MPLPAAAAAGLAALRGVRVAPDVPLASLVSMGVGGPADALVGVDGPEGLAGALDALAAHGIPWFVLGRGTNLLPADAGFRGAVLRLEGAFARVETDAAGLEAGAAASLAALVEQGMRRDLGGLEFTTGIPGCVGGSLPGNAGTATQALGDRVEWVEVAEAGRPPRRIPADALSFGYRTSGLRALGGVVTAARFRLEPRPRAEVAERVRAFTEKRKGQPLAQPNVGCIFRNPPGDSAGRLIDAAGLKGARVGAAEVSAKHANFVVNRGGATGAQVLELVALVRDRVRAAHGIALEPEVVILDEFGRALSARAAAGGA